MKLRNEPPRPPRPELSRRPDGGFGWLDARLVQDHWLAKIGANATATLVLLSIAADQRGASYWSRARMTQALRISRSQLDEALRTLLHHRLVDHRPWRPGHRDGVWQILPIPGDDLARTPDRPDPSGAQLGSILRSLGIDPP